MIRRKNGFSLIELLVVISIIAVLSAILMVNFVGTRERARDSQRIQDLNSLKNALRLYYNDNQQYPIAASGKCSSDLGTALSSSYFPGVTSLSDCTYESDGDFFRASITLEADSGTTDTESQTNCGVGTTESRYMVCAN